MRLFMLFDTFGLPLEYSVKVMRARGGDDALEFIEVCRFAADAAKAGWTKKKIRSELRDAHWLGVKVPEMLLEDPA